MSETRIGHRTLTDLLRLRATEQTDREGWRFLVDGEDDQQSLTYGELERWARGLAAQLRHRSSPGDRAVILLPSGLDYVVAFYGCLYAGLVVVPAYPPQPTQDASALGMIFQDAGARLALTTSSLLEPIRDVLGPVVPDLQLVATDAVQSGAEGDWQEPATRPDDLAWLQYTSGSTSTPKGVMFSHARMLVGMSQIASLLEATQDSRIVLWLPLHFTIGINWVLLVSVYAGAPVTFMAPNVFLDRPYRWLRTISDTQATHSVGPNFAYDLCTRTVGPEERALLDLSSWKVALCGGEATRPDTFDRFGETFRDAGFRMDAFANAYGMTEALSFAADPTGGRPVVRTFDREALAEHRVLEAASGDAIERSFIGCGTRLEAVHVAIVDPETLTECPAGRVGELWVKSQAVALGYWNRPEATEETFGARLADSGEGTFLRTGDLGFFHDGQLFVTGRMKETIIIRGRNLYPQDIERTVEQSHPAVRPECGGAFAVEVDEEELLAVVYEVETDADPAAVTAAIRGAIAARHEVQPYGVVLVRPGTVPRTTTGKLHRSGCRQAFLERRLAAVQWSILGESGVGHGREYVAPRTPTERALASLWEAILGVEPVGMEDDFFELGGDSLLSVQLASHARRQGIGFSPAQLLEHRTIAALAPVVGQPPGALVEQGVITGYAPLTPRQCEAFERPKYSRVEVATVPFLMELPPATNPVHLERALRALLEHHDALRMRFHREGDRWRQHNAAWDEHELFSVLDVSDLSEREQLLTARDAITQRYQAINLSQGPLLQAVLVRRGDQHPSLFMLVIHHLVVDAASMPILIEDLLTSCEQLERGERVTLPPKTTSLKAWTERLAEYAQSREAREELDYWLEMLSAHKPAPLPADYEYDSTTRDKQRVAMVQLSANDTDALLRELPSIMGTRVNETVIVALSRVFEPWIGTRSLFLKLVGHGRASFFADVDLSRTVGWLSNQFPMVFDLAEMSSVEEALRAVRDQLRRVPNSGIGYGALRYLSQDPEVIGALQQFPEPQVIFNYQGQIKWSESDPVSDVRAAMLFSEAPSLKRHPAHGDVEIRGQVHGGVLRLQFGYHRGVYTRETIDRLANGTIEALRTIIAECREHQPAHVSA